MCVLHAPMHRVFLRSPLVSGSVKVRVRAHLLGRGVAPILVNDLAGEKVFPAPRNDGETKSVLEILLPTAGPLCLLLVPRCMCKHENLMMLWICLIHSCTPRN